MLHIALKEGTTLIILTSEATLKGVLDKTIIRVFGPKIYGVITKSLIREREVKEGIRLTEYILMILIKNRAIINLSLSLEGGL